MIVLAVGAVLWLSVSVGVLGVITRDCSVGASLRGGLWSGVVRGRAVSVWVSEEFVNACRTIGSIG